jgi:hypothetical protein
MQALLALILVRCILLTPLCKGYTYKERRASTKITEGIEPRSRDIEHHTHEVMLCTSSPRHARPNTNCASRCHH